MALAIRTGRRAALHRCPRRPPNRLTGTDVEQRDAGPAAANRPMSKRAPSGVLPARTPDDPLRRIDRLAPRSSGAVRRFPARRRHRASPRVRTAVKITAREPGRTCGRRWPLSSRCTSSLVSVSGARRRPTRAAMGAKAWGEHDSVVIAPTCTAAGIRAGKRPGAAEHRDLSARRRRRTQARPNPEKRTDTMRRRTRREALPPGPPSCAVTASGYLRAPGVGEALSVGRDAGTDGLNRARVSTGSTKRETRGRSTGRALHAARIASKPITNPTAHRNDPRP